MKSKKEVLGATHPDVVRAQNLTEDQAKVFVSKKLAALRNYHGRGDYEKLFRFAIFSQNSDYLFWQTMAKKIAEIFVVVSADEIQ
jgi:hypothetical protein